MKKFFPVLILILFSQLVLAQSPIEWQRCLGGYADELTHNVIETSDGGFLILGSTVSPDIVDSSSLTPYALMLHGGGTTDLYLTKLDSQGKIKWQRIIGSFGQELPADILETDDGGFAILAMSGTPDNDATNAKHLYEYWLIKLDKNGAIQWDKSYGGSNADVPIGLSKTKDGGFILTGASYSFDGDVTGNHGADDAWILRLNSLGEMLWQKCLGGGDHDYAFKTLELEDGSLIVAGSTNSTDGDVFGTHGWDDYWLVKLNKYGDFIWQRCFGGSQLNELNDIALTDDGGFLISGFSGSTDGDVKSHILRFDFWLVKTSSTGNLVWEKSYGGENDDATFQNASDNSRVSIRKTDDGGYIVGGSTRSFAGDVSGNHGKNDYWILKIDKDGVRQWQQCLGGSNDDYCGLVIPTRDRGYLAAGFSYSTDGDVKGHHGFTGTPNFDIWIVKLSPSLSVGNNHEFQEQTSVFPNPSHGHTQIKFDNQWNYGKPCVIQVNDISGKKLIEFEERINPNGNIEFDFSELAPGFYTLHAFDGIRNTTCKIVIQ